MGRYMVFFFLFLASLFNVLVLLQTRTVGMFIKNDAYIRVGGKEVYKNELTKLLTSEENKIAQQETLKNSLEEIKGYFANKDKQGNPALQLDNPTKTTTENKGNYLSYLREGSFKPDELSAFKERNNIKGEAIVMLEYSDFGCKYCKKQNEEKIIEKVISRYGDKVVRIFKPYTQDTTSAKNVMCLIEANPNKVSEILDA